MFAVRTGALPARFRRERLLVVGCGDVGLRTVALARGRVNLMALTSNPERLGELRARGVRPVLGNLDDPRSLRRLSGLATRVLHLAPPPGSGRVDPRTAALLGVLARRGQPASLVYGSTTGVYGDCEGRWVSEQDALNPRTDRAHRRVDAEQWVRQFGRASGVPTSILRIPGIYALDRPGSTPQDRLRRQMPVLMAQEDVYTNHVHANDLARACWLALWRTKSMRAYNVSDDSDMKMGDYYDLAADLSGLARPERISRQQATERLSAMTLSFMGESRRLRNARVKEELGLRLHYPTVRDGLAPASGKDSDI